MFNIFSIFDDPLDDVDVDEVKRSMGDNSAILLDVRQPDEYAQGHLKGSILAPVDILQYYLDKIPDKSKKIYVYCRTGNRSGRATKFLKNTGYHDVHNVTGGIVAWMQKGYPIEK